MPSHRAQVIVQLLERYNDLTDPVRAGNGKGTDGFMLMPHEPTCKLRTRRADAWTAPTCTCAMRSIVHLERLLVRMRDDRTSSLLRLSSGEKVSVRSCWWNVNQRYLECVTVTKPLVWRRGKWQGLGSHSAVVAQPGGWNIALASERERLAKQNGNRMTVKVCMWDPGVRLDRVDRGVAWLADSWALSHEPMLPREVMVAA